MSYRAPKIIQNSQGLLQRGKAIDDFNAGLNKEFDDLTKIQVENAKAVEKQQAAFRKRRLKDVNKLNKELTESGLLAQGENSSTAAVLKQIKEEYYKCAGSMSVECAENMAHWKEIPNQIAQGLGASQALTGQYRKIMEHPEGSPNSLDIDNTDPTLNRFGQEFVENDGRNVQCRYDAETRQIYWEIADVDTKYSGEDLEKLKNEDPEAYEELMEGASSPHEEGDYTHTEAGARIYNNALVKTQLDENNKIPFFPTHGDPSKVIGIMHDGNDDVDGLSVGLDKDKKILIKKGKDDKEIEIKGEADINKELRTRLAAYDFSGTLDSPISKTLYSASLRKNLSKLEQLKNKDIEDFNETDRRLAETWYGNDWEDEINNPDAVLEDKDPISVYQQNGTAGFGPWIGSDPNLAKTNANANFQRGVVSNGLIMDYEKEYLYEEDEAKVINQQNAAVTPPGAGQALPTEEEADLALMGVDDATAMAIETDEDKVNVQAKFDSLKPGETMTMKTANGGVETIRKPKLEVEEEVKLDVNGKPIVEEEVKVEEVAEEPKDEVISFTSKTVGDDKKVKAYTSGEETTMSFVDASGNTVNKTITPRSNRLVSETKQDDGADGIRRILNFEGVMGSSSGTGLSDYGFSSSANAKDSKGNLTKGAKLRKAFDKETAKLVKGGMDEKEAKGQAAINVFLDDVMPQAARELGFENIEDFNDIDDNTKYILADWEFNTGRDVGQLAVHAYMTGNKERSKKHPNITEAINGKGTTKKVWEVGGKEETAEQYLTRLVKDADMCLGGKCENEARITEQMILDSKHAIMGDESTRTPEQIKAYEAGHQYRINLFK